MSVSSTIASPDDVEVLLSAVGLGGEVRGLIRELSTDEEGNPIDPVQRSQALLGTPAVNPQFDWLVNRRAAAMREQAEPQLARAILGSQDPTSTAHHIQTRLALLRDGARELQVDATRKFDSLEGPAGGVLSWAGQLLHNRRREALAEFGDELTRPMRQAQLTALRSTAQKAEQLAAGLELFVSRTLARRSSLQAAAAEARLVVAERLRSLESYLHQLPADHVDDMEEWIIRTLADEPPETAAIAGVAAIAAVHDEGDDLAERVADAVLESCRRALPPTFDLNLTLGKVMAVQGEDEAHGIRMAVAQLVDAVRDAPRPLVSREGRGKLYQLAPDVTRAVVTLNQAKVPHLLFHPRPDHLAMLYLEADQQLTDFPAFLDAQERLSEVERERRFCVGWMPEPSHTRDVAPGTVPLTEPVGSGNSNGQ